MSDPDFSKKWRQMRACARCHRLKMKCAYDDPSFRRCKRCFQANVECSQDYDPTLRNRVARSRKKQKLVHLPGFKNLLVFLQKMQTPADAASDRAGLTEDLSQLLNLRLQLSTYISQIDHLMGQKLALLKDSAPTPDLSLPPPSITPQNFPIIPFEKNLVLELIKLSYLSVPVIQERFSAFKNLLLVYWPAIRLSSDVTTDYLIQQKPLLLLLFLASSCAATNDHLLYKVVLYYLDMHLAHRIYISGGLSLDIIQAYLVLLLWNPPPKQWGTFKHQLHLLTAFNLHLVVDLGTTCEHVLVAHTSGEKPELSFQENELVRLYLMVYASCGLLGLSLPKFRCVSWSSTHDHACQYLASRDLGEDRTDVFILYMARLVSIGQEMASALEKDIIEAAPLIAKFEDRLLKLMLDYRLTDPQLSLQENALVGLTYQQILMSMYDYLIFQHLSSTMIAYISDSLHSGENSYKLAVSVLEKLIIVCKRLVETFLKVCSQTLCLPTFFHYRPMNAIISLVKAKILIKLLLYELYHSKLSSPLEAEIGNLDFNLKAFFGHFYTEYETYSKKSVTFEKMFAIVRKMRKLIKLVGSILNKRKPKARGLVLSESGKETVAGFHFKMEKGDPATDSDTVTTNLANNDLLSLLYELGKDKAVENIDCLGLNPETRKKQRQAKKAQKEELNSPENDDQGPSEGTGNGTNKQVNMFFKEIFSDNFFSDILQEAGEEKDNVSQLNQAVDLSNFPELSQQNDGSMADLGAVPLDELSMGLKDGPGDSSLPDLDFRDGGRIEGFSLLNQFLASPSEDLFNNIALNENENVSSVPLVSKSSLSFSGSVEQPNYDGLMFWTNNEHQHNDDIDGLGFD